METNGYLGNDATVVTDAPGRTDGAPPESGGLRRAWTAAWGALSAAIGVIMGLLPHILHHAGFLIGVGLFAGAVGNIVFALLGIVLSIPLLRRLYRRYGTWKAPGIALGVFAVMFALSAFVIGPLINGGPTPSDVPSPASPTTTTDHLGHHSP